MKFKRSILFILLLITFTYLIGCAGNKETLIIKKNKQFSENKNQIEEKKYKLNLLATGDIMFHSPQFKAAYDSNTGVYDFSPVFKYVGKYIKGADIAIANLETVIAGSHIDYSGFPKFNTPEEAILGISEAGFNIISTANNHSLDYGKTGLINTIKTINKYNMKNIGTYIERETPILVEELNGIRLGFLSYTYGLNGMDQTLSSEELSYMVNKIDEEKIESDIEKTKSLGVDLTVVYIHWGYEYQRDVSDYQIELGEKMINWGADIILGSHPHVIQKSEILKADGEDKFIIYSMGNFLSNQRKSSMGNSYTEDGVMINLEIEKNSITGKTKINKIEYIPTWVYRYKENGKLVYEILPVQDVLNGILDINIEDEIKVKIKRSLKDTMSKMNK